jgi:uncharacterized membrane protein
MPATEAMWTEQRVEAIVGKLLRGGVLLAAAVVLAGGVLYLIRHGTAVPDYRVFYGEPADLRRVSGIINDAIALRSRGIIQLGLLLLIATPVVRVAFSVVAFALLGDRLYVGVTLIVLSVLLYSLMGAYL